MHSVYIMLVWGTANPEGLSDDYNGYYFRKCDITEALKEVQGKPVKIEHKGVDVGNVVSAWENNGKLDLLLNIDSSVIEGSVVSSLVRVGACRELSLGYNVQVQASSNGENRTGKKSIVEVSLVRKGDRNKCYIHGFSDQNLKKN